jgi:hypothetical protein
MRIAVIGARLFLGLVFVAVGASGFLLIIFHITMMPVGLPAPFILTILWAIVAWQLRSHFAPLFVQKASI